ncbi:MAG: flagellar basal body rod protein FlgB [Desulfococcaceae bacterium]
MNGADPATAPLRLLERTMDLRSRQHERIAINLANRDTPGFRAFEVDLAAALSTEAESAASLERTHPSHRSGVGEMAPDRTPLRPVERNPASARGDGNTVDLDREMARLSENALMYTAAARVLADEYARIRDAIEE